MKVGSLVECINDTWNEPRHELETLPVKGEIYTIRSIMTEYLYTIVLLEEIINPIIEYADATGECAFLISRFREVQPPLNLTALLEESQFLTLKDVV